MNKTKKLAFFDIDGTLIPNGCNEMLPSTIKALHQLIENGVEVFVCTGRCYHQAKEIIDIINAPNYICSNGQEVCYHNEILYKHTFDPLQVPKVISILEDANINWGFETHKALCIANTNKAQDTKKLLEAYNFDNLCLDVDPLTQPIYQFWLNGQDHIINDLLTTFKTKGYTYYQWRDDLYELLPGNESKAKGIRIVKEFINTPCITYGFGDGINDMEMVKYVDYSVAMGDGINDLQKYATYTTTPSIDDGIVNGLKLVGLL